MKTTMPLDDSVWLDLSAIVSAMCDIINSGHETFGIFYQRRIAARDAGTRSSVLKKARSGFSDDEVKRTRDLLSNGDIRQNQKLLCRVLQEFIEINRGIDRFSDWTQAYQKLGCGV